MKRHILAVFAVLTLTISSLLGASALLPSAANAGNGGPTMTVDLDAGTAGIQATRVVASGQFDISIEATNADTTQGYQWELQWDDATLDFVSATENPGTGGTLCSPATASPSAPVNDEWIGQGAGCLLTSGFMPATVRLTTITLQCAAANGTTSIHLVTGGDGAGEDPVFGSIFFAAGGNTTTSTLVDATSVQCGSGAAPTPTNTATNTPTSTPIAATSTPCVTNCPTATPTFPDAFTRTATPTITSTPSADATSVPVVPAAPTDVAGAPGGTGAPSGGGTRGGILLPDTGQGGADTTSSGSSSWLLALLTLGVSAVAIGAWLRRKPANPSSTRQ